MHALNFSRSLVLATFVAVGASPTTALTVIDFESLTHGEVITDQLLATHGVVISAVNFLRPFDLAVAFDTTVPSTVDPDLNGPPWNGGNIPNENLGKVLILSQINETAPGFTLPPNDEAGRPAGDLVLTFQTPFTSAGFDRVDIDSATAEAGSIEFLKGGTSIATIGWEEFTDPASPFFDPSIEYKDDSANRVSPIDIASLGGGFDSADQIIFHLGGSGGIDNISVSAIPEPGAALLFGLGVFVANRYAGRRRRI